MSNMATASLRQASRLFCRQTAPSAGVLRSCAARVANTSNQTIYRRGYVSATKKNSAEVNVDAIIKADQKAFLKETGTLPEKHIIPGTSVDAGAMMSPMAGMKLNSVSSVYSF
jgi:cysteine desulfurase